MSKELITVGKILKPVGVHGEIKILPLTDFPERFDRLQEVMIETREGRLQRYQIDRMRQAPPYVYIRFAGLSSIEQVDFLRGAFLQIPEEKRAPLAEGNYYRFELKGLDIYLEEGTFLGKLEDIFETGSNDVFVVKSEGREVLIPALRSIVKSVDLAHKRMVVRPVEGLF
ncbi:MAG: ribosome maturation factor RimM [Nitrospiria bacterium]